MPWSKINGNAKSDKRREINSYWFLYQINYEGTCQIGDIGCFYLMSVRLTYLKQLYLCTTVSKKIKLTLVNKDVLT